MNVVFDLGGVVVAWRPDEILARAFEDPETRAIAKRELIGHPEWLELDRGTLTFDEAIERGARRSGLPESDVRRLLESVPPALEAFPETVALLRAVKAAGHALYFLSNMPAESMAYLEHRYDFWELFDGAVVSSRIGFCKPEPEIYKYLIDTHCLEPRETVFIDDVLVNVEAAQQLGIQTIHFASAAQCARELRRLGAL